MKRLVAALFALLSFTTVAAAQQGPAGAVAVGRGGGIGFTFTGPCTRDYLLGSSTGSGTDCLPFVQGGTGALSRTWKLKARDILSARDFLACDGVTDEYTALANLAARANSLGADIYVPGGCLILVNMSGVRAPIDFDRVRIHGATSPTWSVVADIQLGSWFIIKGISNSPLRMWRDSGVIGMGFLWPDQVDPAAPIAYPAAITAGGAGQIVNSEFAFNNVVNAYDFIDLGSNSGLNRIHDNNILALRYAIKSAESYETNWIERNQFSYAPGLAFYTALGKETQLATRTFAASIGAYLTGPAHDGMEIKDNLFFHQFVGVDISQPLASAQATFVGFIDGNNFDSSNYGIRFRDNVTPNPANVSNNIFSSFDPTVGNQLRLDLTGSLWFKLNLAGNQFHTQWHGHNIYIKSADVTQAGTLNVAGNQIDGMGLGIGGSYSGIYFDSPASVLTATGNQFDGWSVGATTTIGITLKNALSAAVTSNSFKGLTNAVFLDGTVSGGLTMLSNTSSAVGTEYAGAGTVGTLVNSLNSWNPTVGITNGGTGRSSLTANALLTGGVNSINDVAITGIVKGNGASAPTAYAGTSCTSQFVRSLDLNAAATCASVAFTDLPTLPGLSVLGVTGTATTTVAAITGTAGLPLRVNITGTGLAFGPLQPLGGGTGIQSYTVGDIIYADTTASMAALNAVATGNALISAGAGVAPAWGKVSLAMHATQATNTVVGNATSGSASPTALTMPSCSTASSAVTWTTNVGFGCNASISASSIPVSGITGLGIGVATALAVNVGTAGAFVVNGGALGTPLTGTLTNATGLPVSTGISGLGTGIATWLATPSSANLAAALTDETGSGAAVFGTSPTIASPTFTGTVAGAGTHPLSTLATQGTNTVVGNATSGSASPTALTMTSCSTAGSAVTWTTNSGFGCNTSITAAAIPVGGITGLGTGVATWLATPSSANFTTAVGRLPFSSVAQIAGLSILGVNGTATADVAAITGTAFMPLRVNSAGTLLAFGSLQPEGGGTGTTTRFTSGSVVYTDNTGSYTQDNATFFWDATNKRLGIGTASPGKTVDIAASGRMRHEAALGAGWWLNSSTTTDRVFVGTTASTDIFRIYAAGLGSNALTIDLTSGSILAPAPTGGLGYGTGAGGTVTQLTSKSTGVTLNKVSGQITMNNESMANATVKEFVLTNSAIAVGDTLIVNIVSGITGVGYIVSVTGVSAGSATIALRNATGSTTTDAAVIGFNVIKGSTS